MNLPWRFVLQRNGRERFWWGRIAPPEGEYYRRRGEFAEAETYCDQAYQIGKAQEVATDQAPSRGGRVMNSLSCGLTLGVDVKKVRVTKARRSVAAPVYQSFGPMGYNRRISRLFAVFSGMAMTPGQGEQAE